MIEVGFDVQSGYEIGWHCCYRRSNLHVSHDQINPILNLSYSYKKEGNTYCVSGPIRRR
jgi:hypothetical protein